MGLRADALAYCLGGGLILLGLAVAEVSFRFPFSEGDRVRVAAPDNPNHGKVGTFNHFDSDVAPYGSPDRCSVEMDEPVYLRHYALPLSCWWWEIEPLEEGEDERKTQA